jgi:hypothetical protein
VTALGEIVCETTLSPRAIQSSTPRASSFTVDLAESRGVDPGMIRMGDPRWKRARDGNA